MHQCHLNRGSKGDMMTVKSGVDSRSVGEPAQRTAVGQAAERRLFGLGVRDRHSEALDPLLGVAGVLGFQHVGFVSCEDLERLRYIPVSALGNLEKIIIYIS